MTRAAKGGRRASHPHRRRLRGQPRDVRAVSRASRASAWTRPTTARRRSTRPGQLLPDLIVMDLSLPGIDGWEATRRLKGRRPTRASPSSRSPDTRCGDHEREATRGGLRRLVTKPCLPEELAARDPAACSRRPRRRSARRAERATACQDDEGQGAEPAPGAAPPARAAAKAPARRAAGAEGRRRRRAGPRHPRRSRRRGHRTAGASTSTASSAPRSRCSFGSIGIGTEPAEVHTISHNGIAAVVSDTPIEVFDATRENVLAHERVNEAVMRQHTVIPMSFGTVFKTREDIVELLRGALRRVQRRAHKMEDKLEFGLKVLWDRDAIVREIETRGRGRPAAQEGDLLPEGLDLLRAHAVRPPARRRAPVALGALRGATSSSSSATSRWPPGPTSPSATR